MLYLNRDFELEYCCWESLPMNSIGFIGKKFAEKWCPRA